MKAIIEVDVPEYQIGQEVSVYFKDTMCVKSVCKKKQTRKNKTPVRSSDSGAWDFHYSGHGDYEEERRCFYGDFS